LQGKWPACLHNTLDKFPDIAARDMASNAHNVAIDVHSLVKPVKVVFEFLQICLLLMW
jgi:hypothetical protein